jgi:hypothetical protein
MTAARVVPLHPDDESPLSAREMRIYWRAYGDGWRDGATDGTAEKEIYAAGFLAGVDVAIAAESAPPQRHLRIVS